MFTARLAGAALLLSGIAPQLLSGYELISACSLPKANACKLTGL